MRLLSHIRLLLMHFVTHNSLYFFTSFELLLSDLTFLGLNLETGQDGKGMGQGWDRDGIGQVGL